MQLTQKRIFTFTWQIQNFSMCPQKFNEELKSPVFLVKMLGNSKWQVEIYPKGDSLDTCVSVYLLCMCLGSNTDLLQVGFTVSVFSNDASKRVTKEVSNYAFNKHYGCGYPCLITRDILFADTDVYLPNNILTIKCLLWRNGDVDLRTGTISSKHQTEELDAYLDHQTRDSKQWNQCAVVTSVGMHRKRISWPIRRFSSIEFNEKLTLYVPSLIIDLPSFFVTFCKSSTDQSAIFEIQSEKTYISKRTFFKCKMSVLQAPKGVDIVAEVEHLYESNIKDQRKLVFSIQLHTLEDCKYFNHTCDVLYLSFELSFSQYKGIYHTENVFIHKNRTLWNFSHPIEDFRELHETGELSDVTIRTGDQEFKAHKIILVARSPVIKAMFDNDMKEKKTGVIDITDVDSGTVDKMLAFMYTDGLDDMLAEDALNLYAAADKYEVLSLKTRCAWILASSLSVSNVCEVLILSDQHNDEYLRDCAEDFFEANSVDIFKSQEWINLMQNNGTIAAKVMLKMLTN